MARSITTLTFALVSLTCSVSALAADTSVDATTTLSSEASLSAPRNDANSEARDEAPPSLFGKKLHVGGYGGTDVLYTRMFGRDGVLAGAQGAVVLNHSLSLGLAGYVWSNPPSGPRDSEGDTQRYQTGYGGATLRYSFYPVDLPVYVTVGGMVGAGFIGLGDWNDEDGDDDGVTRDKVDVYAVFQPDVTLNANLTRWMRVGVTAGYRFTSNVNELGFTNSDLNGVVVGGQLQFGSF